MQRPRFFRVEPLGRDTFPQFFLRLWAVDSLTDTVSVSFGHGFGGQFFRGVQTDRRDLVGIAGVSGDLGPPFEHDVQATRARRIDCGSIGIAHPPPNER